MSIIDTEEKKTLIDTAEKEEEQKSGGVAKDGTKLDKVDENGNPFTNEKEKPENIPDKFWNKEKGELNTEALLKSYTELEKMKKVDTDYDGVPEQLAGKLKELKLDKDQAAGIVKMLEEDFIKDLSSERANVETDKLKLHWGIKDEKEYDKKIADITNWAKANMDIEQIKELGGTSTGVIALETMMILANKKNQTQIGNNFSQTNKITLEDIDKRVADPQYETSREFREETMQMAEKYHKQ